MDIKFNSDENLDGNLILSAVSELSDGYYAATTLYDKLHNVEPFPTDLKEVVDKLIDYVYNQTTKEIDGDGPIYDLSFEKEFFDRYFYVLGLKYEEEIDEFIKFYFLYKFRGQLIFISVLQFGSSRSNFIFETNGHLSNVFNELKYG